MKEHVYGAVRRVVRARENATVPGPLSAWLAATLQRDPAVLSPGSKPLPVSGPGPAGPVREDDDLQLALWCCYKLHYRGFDDVDEGWEWHPVIAGFRALLERQWLIELRGVAGGVSEGPARGVPRALPGLSASPLAVEPWWGDRPLGLWIARRLYDYSHLEHE